MDNGMDDFEEQEEQAESDEDRKKTKCTSNPQFLMTSIETILSHQEGRENEGQSQGEATSSTCRPFDQCIPQSGLCGAGNRLFGISAE